MSEPTSAASARKIMIASFSTTAAARQSLDLLRSGEVRMGNVAIVQRMIDGRVEFTETQDWGMGKSAVVGAIAAMLLPGVGFVTGAIVGALAARFVDAGFPDSLIRQLGGGMPSGTSMIVALVNERDLAQAESILENAGGRVLASGLEGDLEAALRRMGGGA